MRVIADSVLAAPIAWGGSASLSARGSGFALLGESLLANAPKGTKRSCPYIRVSLRSTSLIPSALRGPAYKGHPWPFTPLAASMPLTPLRADYIRPSERGVRRRLVVDTSKRRMGEAHRKSLKGCAHSTNCQTTRSRISVRRLSAISAEGVTPLAVSMLPSPLHTNHIRRGVCLRLVALSLANKHSVLLPLLTNFQTTRSQFPVRRPNAGVAQGDARHGCRARSDGQGWPFATPPGAAPK
jgi:hypothetical protein